jgi:VWFA-related protein
MRRAWTAGVVTALGAAAWASGPVAQERQFRAGTDTVPVYVTVRDRDGAFVLDLTRDDFELRDNGVPQPLTQFTTDVQPLSTFVLIDGSGSMLPEFDRAVEGATNFVVRMLPHDRTRIGSFAERIRFGPRFTSDRDELLAFLEDEFNIIIGPETHLWEAVLEASLALGSESGKRVVIALSDGYNFVLPPGASQAGGTLPPPGGRGPTGLPIPRPPTAGPGGGLPPGFPPTAGTPRGRRPGAPAPPPPAWTDPATTGVSAQSARDVAMTNNVILYAVSMWVRQPDARAERPSRDLERMAIDTGGGFFEVRESADMTATFARIVQELRQQYVLGFTPKVMDGKSHRLDVRVKRPGVEVTARRSYLARRDAR